MTSKQARVSMKENKWVNIMKSVQYPGKLRLLFLKDYMVFKTTFS